MICFTLVCDNCDETRIEGTTEDECHATADRLGWGDPLENGEDWCSACLEAWYEEHEPSVTPRYYGGGL